MTKKSDKRLLLGLIFLSGTAGLIYQVVWQKYLSILLGAQARATAVVLAIFLGGICAGYAAFGRWSARTKWNLLGIYAAVELALGLWAYLFPFLFRGALHATGHFYAVWGVDNLAVDILVSVVLIGPPTFLMGGTLPLLTQGLSEDFAASSRTHAAIYGFNTLGACLGSLLAGYLLIPMTNLPITVMYAGFLNILVAVIVHFRFVRRGGTSSSHGHGHTSSSHPHTHAPFPLYAVGFLSGLYIITLETVLIRLMGLSTGSSNYNFTLILSIFVFGLGFGSLLVRRIGHYTESRLFWNQITISASLLVLYLTADSWPYWVHLIRVIFRDQAENFYLYQFLLGLFFLGLLAIPVGLCGLTMPLCFHLGKDRQETLGHRVGQLYAINTLGCVLGALGGGYLALHFLNLDQLFKACVFASLVSALCAGYLYLKKSQPDLIDSVAGGVLFGLVLIGTFVAPLFSKEIFIQPFRQQSVISGVTYFGKRAFAEYLASSTKYLFYKDGPNTSVGVGQTLVDGEERSRTIFVNGKSDGNTHGDLLTMALTGHIPGVLAPKLDKVCVIGFGTGITTGALASYRETGSVDVVEIADTVIDSAHYFDPYNGGASENKKVHFHQMDAFRFLGGQASETTGGFDVIVSEPSNPWVAGVENLYSIEFYDMIKRRLNPDGVFVQWVQTYSFNDELFKMVLRTITQKFPRVSVFQMLEHDVALVAWPRVMTRADLKLSEERLQHNPAVRHMLEQTGITRLEGLLAFEIVPPELTGLLPEAGPIQRLEAPRLSHGAARAFFSNSSAKVHSLRKNLKEYYPLTSHFLLNTYLEGAPLSKELVENFRMTFCESPAHRSNILCEETLVMAKLMDPTNPYEVLYGDLFTPTTARDVASFQPFPKKTFSRGDLIVTQRGFDMYKGYYSAIAPLPIAPIVARLDACIRLVDTTSGLYGDCLLQKAAVLEIAIPEDPDFLRTVHVFMDWFAHLAHEHEDYARFHRAADILNKMLEDLLSTPATKS